MQAYQERNPIKRSCLDKLKPMFSNALGSPVKSPVAAARTCDVSIFIHAPFPPEVPVCDEKGFHDDMLMPAVYCQSSTFHGKEQVHELEQIRGAYELKTRLKHDQCWTERMDYRVV